jgi:DNA-binding CsgD family transcriptional regulator
MLGLLDDPLPALELQGREKEVASLVSRGLSRGECAKRLDISESSVKRYAMRVSQKAGFPARKLPSLLIHEFEVLIKEALK